jgi:hypothetical protein
MDNFTSNSLTDRLNAIPYRMKFFLAMLLLIMVLVLGCFILFVTGRLF